MKRLKIKCGRSPARDGLLSTMGYQHSSSIGGYHTAYCKLAGVLYSTSGWGSAREAKAILRGTVAYLARDLGLKGI